MGFCARLILFCVASLVVLASIEVIFVRTVFGSTTNTAFSRVFITILSFMMILAFQLAISGDANARKKRKRGNPLYAAIVVDAKTGKVLHSSSANSKRYPASLTKMMTLYLIFEDLKAGRITKSSRVVMTRAGARRPPSKLGLRVGQSISMEQAIYSLVTKSANDVSTAIGDKLAGTEAKFAQRMTRKARQLGMNSTTFKNANGLTARGQLTTAADMAKLGMALREHFPRQYKYFNTRVFKFGKRRYGNHNKLLGKVSGVDGIKTGYTRASGFNLVSSVSSRNRRIVAVVMGGRTGARRNAQMKRLISRYLHKASTGKSRRQIARATSSRSGTSSRQIVTSARTTAVAGKANALIATRVEKAHATAQANTSTVAGVEKQLVKLDKRSMPKPELRPSVDLVRTASIGGTLTSKKVSGWQIQIAASDSKSKLHDLMKTVQSKNPRMLGKKAMSMPSITRNGKMLYRGRFSGFTSKRAANDACKALKRQRTDCLALNL